MDSFEADSLLPDVMGRLLTSCMHLGGASGLRHGSSRASMHACAEMTQALTATSSGRQLNLIE
jgi:hypothetical protein